jgi:hypothetical protein
MRAGHLAPGSSPCALKPLTELARWVLARAGFLDDGEFLW